MAGDTCACGEATASFELVLPPDYEKGRILSQCRRCKQKYEFVMPRSIMSRPIMPPTMLKTHMEGDVIVVDHWRDSNGEVGG
jgi:hypothetical protein